MDFVALVVFIVVQIIFIPLAIVGFILVAYKQMYVTHSLAKDPLILVADEPAGNLDSNTAEAIFRLFESLLADQKTILMVAHDGNLTQRVSRTVIIADGEIVNTQRSRDTEGQEQNITPTPSLSLLPASTPKEADYVA